MTIALWIVQGLLGLIFLGAGTLKLLKSKAELEPRMTYVEDLTATQTKVIGALEVLGGLGMILPGVTGILPILTPLAAIGLTLTMIGAALLHIRRRESFLLNIVLFAMAVFVVLGRFLWVPLG